MKMERKLNWCGALLVAVFFCLSAYHVGWRTLISRKPDQTVLRFAHEITDKSIRRAFDEVAELYMAEHPGVQIEQVAVPRKVFQAWAWTNFTGGGGRADILMMDSLRRSNQNEMLIANFLSFNEAMEEPNPYNKGTDLEGAIWRETFVDGLRGGPGGAYLTQTMTFYGAPLIARTYRIIYNKDLFEKILGKGAAIPANFEELVAICERIKSYRTEKGRVVYPMATQFRDNEFLRTLFRSQTLALGLETGWQAELLRFNSFEAQLAYYHNRWTLDDPHIRNSLKLVSTVSRYLQPGFIQADFQDALFYFTQERAAMMVAESRSMSAIQELVPFEIGIFEFPLPDTNHPEYGFSTLGKTTEAGVITRLIFAILKNSENKEVALDFIHFLTSRRVNAKFSQLSLQLPAVSGIEPPQAIAEFKPNFSGYRPGFDFENLGNESKGVYSSLFYLLLTEESIEPFVKEAKRLLPAANQADLEAKIRSYERSLQYEDSWLGALALKGDLDRAMFLVETQNSEEGYYRFIIDQTAEDPSTYEKSSP